jgi:hypothetical protein
MVQRAATVDLTIIPDRMLSLGWKGFRCRQPATVVRGHFPLLRILPGNVALLHILQVGI